MGAPHLSVVMPSHRHGITAYSRIAEACSWAGDEIEVIIRDNSAVPAKRESLERLPPHSARIVFAEDCDYKTNFLESLALARGEFVYFIADDDLCFDRGIAAIADAAKQFAGETSIAGITGLYQLEEHRGSATVGYQGVDSSDIMARILGYLSYQGPNLMFYAPLRREVLERCWTFVRTHPFAFPFHDQILSLLYLLSGRFARIGRSMMVYDNMNWDTVEKAHEMDRKIYAAAGMDPALVRLNWLLCALEGAYVALHSQSAAPYTVQQRLAVASNWYGLMFKRFLGDQRGDFGSRFGLGVEALCAKWRDRRQNIALDELFGDICGFIESFSPQKAKLYREFWQDCIGATPPEPAPIQSIRW